MIKKILLIILLFFGPNNLSYSNENDCSQFKKLSVKYIKCKSSSIKDKTISVGKNIVEDTKNYQKKEWSDEKEKLDKIKKQVLEK